MATARRFERHEEQLELTPRIGLSEPLLRPEDAAELLSVKVSWIYEACRTGRLPFLCVGSTFASPVLTSSAGLPSSDGRAGHRTPSRRSLSRALAFTRKQKRAALKRNHSHIGSDFEPHHAGPRQPLARFPERSELMRGSLASLAVIALSSAT
jgi:hypothetical protein